MVKYSIVAHDDNPVYEGFWDLVKFGWNRFIQITPVLARIGDRFNFQLYNDSVIIDLPAVQSINTGFQAQIARMWVTKFFPNNLCTLSDIDMINLDKKYFNQSIANSDNLVVYSSDHAGSNRYPMCYVQGTGNTFNQVLDLSCDWEAFVLRLHSLNAGWSTDEVYLTRQVNAFYDQSRIVKLSRGWVNNVARLRIDRVNIQDHSSPDEYQEIAQYIDFHCPRPLSQWKDYINAIIEYKLMSLDNE